MPEHDPEHRKIPPCKILIDQRCDYEALPEICDCAQSPIRKFYPYAVAAQQRGIRIHQLNIGQPDIQTPPAFFEAIEAGRRDVLAYAESPGIPALLEAIRAYYARIGASFETQDILVTTGGSEAPMRA